MVVAINNQVKQPVSVLPPTKRELRQMIAKGENLGWKRPFTQILANLHGQLPYDYLSVKELKGNKIIYLQWHTCNMILDFVAPGWGIKLRENQISDRAVVTAKITLMAEEGLFSRESTGSDDTADVNFGGFMPDAESQAMRRAAARFDLRLYLYDPAVINWLKGNVFKSR